MSMFLHRIKIRHFVLLALSLISALTGYAEDRILFRDDFVTLADWEPLEFPKIKRHTIYGIQDQGDDRGLVAESTNAASALVHKQSFDVTQYSTIRWQWKVDNVYAEGNYREKSGEDYPLRVYVFFEYDPQTAPFGMKITYGLAKTVYGRYPPHSSVNYIWANRAEETEPAKSPYTDRSIMIPLQSGPENTGRWMEQTVNVLNDYRQAFGEDPPKKAFLAIMNDSDNTGGSAVSHIRFIEVRK